VSAHHWSSARRRTTRAAGLAVPLEAALPAPADAASTASPKSGRWDVHLEATPKHLHWGGFPIDWEPAVTIASGKTVRVDMLSQQGATQSTHPHDYFAAFGAGPEAVLPDAVAFWESRAERMATGRQYGGHVLTGPIYVEGAELGDTIAIDIMNLETRTPYGFNNTSAAGGVMATSYPGWRDGDSALDIPASIPAGMQAGVWPDVHTHMYEVAEFDGKEVVHFSDDLKIPARPFPGIVAVAPESGVFIGNTEDAAPPATGVQDSTPPWTFGGNLDVRDLCSGSTLYLPVFQSGAQVFIGDPHSAQGDGEVSGTAVEHSLVGNFRFTVIKNTPTELPWAENHAHWILMGIHWDLDRAMRQAVERTVDFLVNAQGMTVPKAYSFASIGVNYHAAEVVDRTQVVTGFIPKDIFGV